MSQSRAERRRSARGGNAPPPKRDPMMPIYLGLAVVVILIFAGFGITNFLQNKARSDAYAFATNTPTPGPSPTAKPIQLTAGESIGKAGAFPTGDFKRNISTDQAGGGHGQDVDGIPCQTNEGVQLHIHSQLSIFVHGKLVQIPEAIGIVPIPPQSGCLYWIHTHDNSGVIHVESGSVSAPGGGPYTLGMFFDIWGEPLSSNQVGPFKGPVTAYVNSQPYTGDLRAIPLRSHQRITLEVGQPVVPPPTYLLPPGD
jgi:hypothetical protein